MDSVRRSSQKLTIRSRRVLKSKVIERVEWLQAQAIASDACSRCRRCSRSKLRMRSLAEKTVR